jgi:acyl-CoA synthetase (AMP-forming)/AMP-acid ligase II/cytochrome P450/acyl carrier protein
MKSKNSDLAPLPQVNLFSEILAIHAENKPKALAYAFLEEGKETKELTYQQLDEAARRIAAELLESSDESSNVLLLFPQGHEFIQAFLGCVYAGFPSVPLSMPRAKQSLIGLERVAINCGAKIVLCTSATLAILKPRITDDSVLNYVKWIAVDQLSPFQDNIHSRLGYSRKSGDPLFLQYTSGSTGNPKGVIVSHQNLIHNIHSIASIYKHTTNSVIVSWLPQFHDMGLIGSILQALYVGFPGVILSPAAFVQKPYLWLKAISDYQGTAGGGPNFAFDLCVSKITEEQAESLDLSSWEIAWTGAEPVRMHTLSAFAERFQSTGFSRKAFFPCYGLAECTLMATGGDRFVDQVSIKVDRSDLYDGEMISPVIEDAIDAHTLVSCGRSFPDQEVRIVATIDQQPLPELKIGEIYVKGPSVAQGYWNNSVATEENFDQLVESQAGFFRTGDLGFLHQQELYVVGRVKETMKINGRNIYPQDIEFTVCEAHESLRPNSAAAFSIVTDTEERLVIVCELKRENMRNFDGNAIQKAVYQAVSDEYAIAVYDFVLIKTMTLPITTSGKIKRLQCRALYLDQKLELVYSSLSSHKKMNTAGLNQDMLLTLPASLRLAQLTAFLKTVLGATLGCDPLLFDSTQIISELGLDSIQLVELKIKLDFVIGSEFPLEMFVKIKTLGELAKEALIYFNANELDKTRVSNDKPSTTSALCPGPSSPEDLVIIEKLNHGFFDYLLKSRLDYGKIVRFVWGKQTFFMISEPDYMREICMKRTDDFIRGDVFIGIRIATNLDNLFTSEGDSWKVQRALADPQFTKDSVERFADCIPGIVLDYMTKKLQPEQSVKLDLVDACKEITLIVILKKLLSLEDTIKIKSIFETLKNVGRWDVPLYYVANQRVEFSEDYYSRFHEELDQLIHEIIDQHLDYPELYDDVIGAYITSEYVQSKTRNEQHVYLRSIVLTYILAGFESTGSGLFSSLYLLATHPNLFQQVRDEVNEIFSDTLPLGKNITTQLPRTYAAVREALRLYPPVWFNGREAARDTSFQGYDIHKGDIMLTSPYVIHRNPEYWQDPEDFRPDRFYKNDFPSNAYVPFGLGERHCVGRWMALYEIVMVAATLIQHYDVSVECQGEFKLDTHFTLFPKNLITATLRSI